MLPGAARVGRLVDAVADGKVGAAQAFSAADIDRARTGGGDGQRSDRTGAVVVIRLVIIGLVAIRLSIEDRVPSAAEVGRLPNSAVVGRHVEDIRLARHPGNRHRASPAKRPDHAPVEFLVHRWVIVLGKKREREKQDAERSERNPKESLVHGWSSKKSKDKPRRRGLDSARARA